MKLQVFIPLFNINVPEDFINKDFSGFKFITNKIFTIDYEFGIIAHSPACNFVSSIKADILGPREEIFYQKPLSKYILFKEYEVNYKTSNGSLCKEFEQNIRDIQVDIEAFLLAMRFTDRGRIQVNKGYMFSVFYQNEFNLHSSTPIENISTRFRTLDKILPEYEYNISQGNIKNIVEILKRIHSLNLITNETMAVPILNWMHYYKSKNLFDRVFKLSTIFECTILADVKNELSYRLGIRCCKFLGKNVYKTLKVFYDLRSSIVHNGHLDDETHKKIKKIISKKYDTIEALFIFLNDYIEPIIREILCKSLDIFASGKIKNYIELSQEIEKQILSDISQKSLSL